MGSASIRKIERKFRAESECEAHDPMHPAIRAETLSSDPDVDASLPSVSVDWIVRGTSASSSSRAVAANHSRSSPSRSAWSAAARDATESASNRANTSRIHTRNDT